MIVSMEHVTKKGDPKILDECTLPLTGIRCVHTIVTDLAVIDVTDAGLELKELAPGVSIDDVQKATEPKLIVRGDVPTMPVG